jgi:hypothetical protein
VHADWRTNCPNPQRLALLSTLITRTVGARAVDHMLSKALTWHPLTLPCTHARSDGARRVDLDTLPEEEEAAGATALSSVLTRAAADGHDAFLEGDVPRAVYRAAVGQFPHDTKFHLELIELVSLFPSMAPLINEAYDALGNDAVAVAARCARPVRDLARGSEQGQHAVTSAVVAAIEKFERALAADGGGGRVADSGEWSAS